jgi:hypothetical protein
MPTLRYCMSAREAPLSPARLERPLTTMSARSVRSSRVRLNTGAAASIERAKNQSHASVSIAYATEGHWKETNSDAPDGPAAVNWRPTVTTTTWPLDVTAAISVMKTSAMVL